MMFVTDALRQQVGNTLDYIDLMTEYFSQLEPLDGSFMDKLDQRLAAERALYVAIECVTDVASTVIDALVMRDPANYEDMMKVLLEERVVTRTWFEQFIPAFELRHQLVREYVTLTPAAVLGGVKEFAPLFRDYSETLRRYLGISPL